MSVEIISVTKNNRDLLLLSSCVAIHCQLRLMLNRFINSPHGYAAYIEQMYQSGDSRMCLVLRRQESDLIVVALAFYGYHLNTANEITFDTFDFIVDEKERNQGLGTRLFRYLIDEAKRGGALSIVIRCDLTNITAQRFFFRQGMIISSFGFSVDHLKSLTSSPEIEVIDITDLPDEQNEHWLSQAQMVHRQFDPRLPLDQQKYIAQMRSICRTNPTRLLLAISKDNQMNVLGVAAYRVIDDTQYTRHFYCDDLVTDERKRCLGVGRCLINAMKDAAHVSNANCIILASGFERPRAHKFYYREGFIIDHLEFTLLF
jgi:GNAT superfamily N-acetyltransferase